MEEAKGGKTNDIKLLDIRNSHLKPPSDGSAQQFETNQTPIQTTQSDQSRQTDVKGQYAHTLAKYPFVGSIILNPL